MTVRSTAIRLGAVVAAALITVAGAPAVLLPAALEATASAAPLGLFAADLGFVVESVTPTVVTRDSPDQLLVTGTVTNTADVPVSDLIVRFQRGDALTTEAAVSQNLADPGQPDAVIAGDWQSFGTEGATFAAGDSRPFRLSTAIAGTVTQGLGITRPGVYPVMANINGTREVDGVPSSVRLGELHLLVTVTSLAEGASGTGPQPKPRPSGAAAVPFGITWPISSIPHRTIGGAFTSEALAGEISQGGALAANLDALQQSELPAVNVVIVIDPMLLDELDMMAHGYRVVAPGSAPAPLDPATGTSVEEPATTAEGETSASASSVTSASAASTAATVGTSGTSGTSGPVDETGTVAGAHAAAATAFLDRLRGLSESSQVLVLPYSDPDAVRLTGAGQGSLVRTLRAEGGEIAARVLQRTDLVTDVALPPGAVLDADTVDVYQRIGFRSLLVSRSGVSGTPQSGGVGRIAGTTTTLPTFVGDQTLQPQLAQVLDPQGVVPGAGALNAAVALLAVRHTTGSALPVLQLPGTTVDVRGLASLGRAVVALSGDGVTTGVDVTTMTKGASAIANLGTALPADAALLPQDYVDRLVATRATITRTASVIDPNPSRSGAGHAVIRALDEGVDGLFSASLRSATAPGDAVLLTAEDSLTRIQNAVSIRTGAGSYTLASADSPLVLTVQNRLPFPVTVRVTVTSGLDAGLKLELPPSIELSGKQSRSISIPSSVSRAGTFSVTVQLANPGATSRPWGEGQKIEIRSNAYGALTLILMISAGGVLFLMVGLRLVQRVRERGKALVPVAPTDSIAAMAEEAAQGSAADSPAPSDPGAPRTSEPQESIR
ncbi:hypothetical protein ABLG96_21570 [Nakamurella sp. A5-74]|uniref:Glycoprotein n=1 Tax=Nakamurella sp. A5-74 TaxID=3158264 RepID=A0AAU8DQV9_9ACTN